MASTGRWAALLLIGILPLQTACSTPAGALLDGRADGPRIVAAADPVQCVPFAREASGIGLMGDAWTWWRSAANGYRRDSTPAEGAILVLRKTNRLRYGHLAVVTRVLSKREVLVQHANWLNRGQVHKDIPVHDVSPANDWSAVRVWYVPAQSLGKRVYPAYGFIHSGPQRVDATAPLPLGSRGPA
jgi:surface antigen